MTLNTTNRNCLALIIGLAVLSVATQATAQDRQNTSYTGLQVLMPTGDAEDLLDTGFGLTGSSQVPLGSAIDFVLEGAWYSFSGQGSQSIAHLGFNISVVPPRMCPRRSGRMGCYVKAFNY